MIFYFFMLYKDYKLNSGLISLLEYEYESDNDNIDILSLEDHDTIYQLINNSNFEGRGGSWTKELVELMRMLILTPSVETICDKWLRLTGNIELLTICRNLEISVKFTDDLLYEVRQSIIEQEGLLFRMKIFPYRWDTIVIANNGHLECLKYAHENGSSFSINVSAVAARRGHLDCLKYLHEQKCPWGVSTTAAAASNGSLDCLKYLHEQGCPLHLPITRYAARNGHLDCLKYAHEQGCPWNSEATRTSNL